MSRAFYFGYFWQDEKELVCEILAKDIGLMGHPLERLIEEKIRQAQADGAFEDLPGAGRPLVDGDGGEDALIVRMLKEAKAAPQFVALGRELAALREELAQTAEPTRRRDIMKEMSMMDARIALARNSFKR